MDIDDYNNLARSFGDVLSRIISDHKDLIFSKEGVSEKRKAIIKEHKQNNDNLFSSIFKFRLENFHSEMLSRILDKNTGDTGNAQYLKIFQDILCRINPALKQHGFDDKASVEREYGRKKENGRIDIFIHDDTHAIIIENKINYAPDQPNQLAKYLRCVKSEGKEVVAIVYMPLYKSSFPPLDDYDDAYKDYIDEIKEKLVVLPALDVDYPEKDMAHGFLGACLELPGNTEKQKYFLLQYVKLLKSIEGVGKMTAEIDMEILAGLYKDKKSISTMENIAEIWGSRESLLGGLIQKPAREKLIRDFGFSVDEEDENGIYKEINDQFMLCYCSSPDDNLIYVGFWSNGKLTGNGRKILEEALDILPEAYFGKPTDWEDPQTWLVKRFRIGEYKEPLVDIVDYLTGRYKALEERLKSLAIVAK
jgi:hypothetical protein